MRFKSWVRQKTGSANRKNPHAAREFGKRVGNGILAAIRIFQRIGWRDPCLRARLAATGAKRSGVHAERCRTAIRSGFSRLRKEARRAIPGFRTAWEKVGYYVCVLLLLAILGTAAHAYRTGNSRSSTEPQVSASPEPAVVISGPVGTPAPQEEEEEEEGFLLPLEGDIVGEYEVDSMQWSDVLEQWRIHSGIDIAAPQGCVVYAAQAGVVESAYEDALMGNVIVLRHEDGYKTIYMGLKTLSLVEPGQEVERGQAISSVGDTALAEKDLGSHLHYEVWLNGEAIEPIFAKN